MVDQFALQYGFDHVEKVMEQPGDSLVLMTSAKRFQVLSEKAVTTAGVPYLTKSDLHRLACTCPAVQPAWKLAMLVAVLREFWDMWREQRFGVHSPLPQAEYLEEPLLCYVKCSVRQLTRVKLQAGEQTEARHG